MTIPTHKLLVLFFCVSTATAIAMQPKDFIKILDKTVPAAKKSVTFAPQKKQCPDAERQKKNTIERNRERYIKYNIKK